MCVHVLCPSTATAAVRTHNDSYTTTAVRAHNDSYTTTAVQIMLILTVLTKNILTRVIQ